MEDKESGVGEISDRKNIRVTQEMFADEPMKVDLNTYKSTGNPSLSYGLLCNSKKRQLNFLKK